MPISRRLFLAGAAAGALAPFAGCAGNPAPVVEAGADRSLPLPAALDHVGAQAKVLLPGQRDPILVWRTRIGFGGTALRCTHCRAEVVFHPEEDRLKCLLRGCEYGLDGRTISGPERKPLHVYLVDLQGDRLRILG